MTLFLVLGLATGALGFSSSVSIDGEIFNLDTLGNFIPKQTVWNKDGFIVIAAAANADPVIAYGIAVVDFGAPSTFGFSFSVANDLPASPNTVVNSSIVGGLTDYTGNGVSISPVAGATLLQDNYLDNLPAFVWSVGPGVAFGPGDPGAHYVYGPYNYGPAPGPGNPPLGGNFTTTLDFILTGEGDIAVLTGYCAIVPAPIPPTLLLMGVGLLGLVGLRLRKK